MLFSVVTMVRGIIAEAEDEVYEGKPLKSRYYTGIISSPNPFMRSVPKKGHWQRV